MIRKYTWTQILLVVMIVNLHQVHNFFFLIIMRFIEFLETVFSNIVIYRSWVCGFVHYCEGSIKNLLLKLHIKNEKPTRISEDNRNAIILTENHIFQNKIDVNYHFIRDVVVENIVIIEYINTYNQIDDIY